MRHRRSNQWHHALALARSGCAAPVAPSQLDIPARSAVRAQGRTDPRSLCPSLEGQGAGRGTSFCAPTRRPAFRPGTARILRCHRRLAVRSVSSTNTSARALWPIWRPGTFIGRRCSDAANARPGFLPFGRLVAQAMGQKPYRSANRVFLVVDNGSSHRGQRAADRLRARWPNIVLVHTPVHASWP